MLLKDDGICCGLLVYVVRLLGYESNVLYQNPFSYNGVRVDLRVIKDMKSPSPFN